MIEEIIEGEALVYIAGYVAYRFRLQYSFLGNYTKNVQFSPHKPDWVSTLSDGHLIYPSDHFIEAAFIMNKIFEEFHGTTLSKSRWIFKTVTKLTMEKVPKEYGIPEEVMLCLVRTRTHITLRELNKKLVSDVKNKRLYKKVSKFMY